MIKNIALFNFSSSKYLIRLRFIAKHSPRHWNFSNRDGISMATSALSRSWNAVLQKFTSGLSGNYFVSTLIQRENEKSPQNGQTTKP